MPRKNRYSQSVSKLAEKTGRPYKQIQEIFKGDSESLYRIAKKAKPGQAFSKYLYEQKVKRYQKTLGGVSRQVATTYLKTIPKYTKTRLETYYLEKGESIGAYRFQKLEKSARYIRTGPNAGKYKVFFDSYNRTPVTVEMARAIRTDARAQRIKRFLTGASWKDIRKLRRYFTPADIARIKKRKGRKPTEAEANRAAQKIAKRWGHKLFVQWQEIFGGPSP